MVQPRLRYSTERNKKLVMCKVTRSGSSASLRLILPFLPLTRNTVIPCRVRHSFATFMMLNDSRIRKIMTGAHAPMDDGLITIQSIVLVLDSGIRKSPCTNQWITPQSSASQPRQSCHLMPSRRSMRAHGATLFIHVLSHSFILSCFHSSNSGLLQVNPWM